VWRLWTTHIHKRVCERKRERECVREPSRMLCMCVVMWHLAHVWIPVREREREREKERECVCERAIAHVHRLW